MQNYDLIIRNGQIVTKDSIFQGEIAAHGGKIVEMSINTTLRNTKGETAANGLHIMSGDI